MTDPKHEELVLNGTASNPRTSCGWTPILAKIQFEHLQYPKTNIFALKMVVSNRNLLFQGSIFRCHVSFRKGTLSNSSFVDFYHLKHDFD